MGRLTTPKPMCWNQGTGTTPCLIFSVRSEIVFEVGGSNIRQGTPHGVPVVFSTRQQVMQMNGGLTPEELDRINELLDEASREADTEPDPRGTCCGGIRLSPGEKCAVCAQMME